MDEFKYLATKNEKYSFEDLCLLAKLLRAEGGCPWDREQTHKSIRKDIIEETYEVIEAIDKEDPELMREELGDILWQVVFHAELEREEGRADMSDIVHDICAKLVHRHPHVFGTVVAETSDVVLDNWDDQDRGKATQYGDIEAPIRASCTSCFDESSKDRQTCTILRFCRCGRSSC